MTLAWANKDPDEVLDYKLDWSARLGAGNTIVTSIWIVPAGLTKDSDVFTTTTTTIWLSGGVLGVRYELTNRITTTGGHTMDQSVHLRVAAK